MISHFAFWWHILIPCFSFLYSLLSHIYYEPEVLAFLRELRIQTWSIISIITTNSFKADISGEVVTVEEAEVVEANRRIRRTWSILLPLNDSPLLSQHPTWRSHPSRYPRVNCPFLWQRISCGDTPIHSCHNLLHRLWRVTWRPTCPRVWGTTLVIGPERTCLCSCDIVKENSIWRE